MLPKQAGAQSRKGDAGTHSVSLRTSSGDTTARVRPEFSFPVVAIGASAGGLAAFNELLHALPTNSGMAFVLIQHLQPKHKSVLAQLLSNVTRMPVLEVSNGIPVEPNHVYVIPPNKNVTIRRGTLRLTTRSEVLAPRRPIDDFYAALARKQGNLGIGVVLSGTGSDGTQGLRAIKAAGGTTFAQDPETAQRPAMPLSAIAAGVVDYILSPKRIAAQLARIGRRTHLVETRGVVEDKGLDEICLVLRTSLGVDFRLYKQATVRRRIARRIALHKVASLTKYAQILKQDPNEAESLARDIFIHVTRFFRDSASFQALRKRVLSKLCPKRSAGDSIRIWVAGCSTGEEVYSLAMLLLEEQSEPTARSKIQIFGTDILEHTVEQARAGTYSKAAVAGVSQARLKRFFVKTKQGYRIQKFVRDLCVFARHDLAQDPPFSRLDLIACRNVLIYMGPALQKRVLSIFQYALKPGGFLFLGNSESINDFSDSFAAEDRNHRIFVRKLTAPAFRDLISAPARFREPGGALAKANAAGIPASFRAEAEKILLGHYSPPALVVDPDLHIVHFQGDTSPYLAPATGQPSFHLLKMVRPELVVDLSSAIYKARKERATVRKDNVSFVHKGQLTAVRLEARPLKDRHGKWQHLLVVFRKVKPVSLKKAPTTSGAAGATKHTAHRLEKLERELASTREHLRAVITEYEAAQDEMKTANEEILSSNEEMQASNDELETAKEELQASNEELVTLNEELRHRNSELVVLTHELSNLLVGVDLPVVVLDAELRIRRFTPVAATALNLSASDVGRPFSKSASRLDVPDWEPLFSEVTKNGRLIEREVSDRKGHRYSLRLRPYQASENTAEGVLLVLLDTDLIYRARDQAQKSGEEYARAIVETIHEALVVADSECRVLTVNRSFCRLFQVTPESMERKSVLGTGAGQFARPKLRELILEVFSKNKEIQDLELVQDFPEIGLRDLVLNARRIDTAQAVLIAITDVTERKRAQKELERSESTIRTLLDSSPQSVVAMDAGAKIMLVNANTEKMFGYRREELLGQPLERLVPAHRLMGSGVDLEGHRKDGSTFPVEVGMSAIETAAGTWSVAFMSDITQRKHEEQASQLHAQEVRALAASLLTAQEEERRRVSRELHDQICQQLASLAIDIGGLAADPPPPEDARRRLKGLQARAVKASEGTRHIAYELHSSVLDDLGLVASLQSLCREFSEPSNLAVEFNSAVPSGSVPREVASCLNRIAQESLQNVAKHASAKHVSVALTLQNGTVVLTVEDDGVGFDVDAVKGRGGLGLISMEERARLINGKLSIATQMGRGTRVTLEVPVSR